MEKSEPYWKALLHNASAQTRGTSKFSCGAMKGILKGLLNFVQFLVEFCYLCIESFLRVIVPYSWQPNLINLDGEKVLITGSAGALGRELAFEFARLNCKLFLLDINERENNSIADQCEKIPGFERDIHVYTCDLSNRDSTYRCAEKIRKDAGGYLDVLVLNAGVGRIERFEDVNDDEMETMVAINALSQLTKVFLPYMIEHQHGYIMTISSIAGKSGYPYMPIYSSTKFFLCGFIESLKLQLSREKIKGVHTLVVCPHFLESGAFGTVACGHFPSLFKPVGCRQTAQQAVGALRAGRLTLIVPRRAIAISVCRGLLADNANILLTEYLGVLNYTRVSSKTNTPNKTKQTSRRAANRKSHS